MCVLKCALSFLDEMLLLTNPQKALGGGSDNKSN